MENETCKGCGTMYINVESEHVKGCLVIENARLLAELKAIKEESFMRWESKERWRKEAERLSTGLVSRIEGTQNWVSVSAAETALNYIDRLKVEARELTDALKNMVGCFGEAATKLQMGKAFGEFHAEAVRFAKETLRKYAKENA